MYKQTIKLEGPALELAKQIQQNQEEGRKAHEALQEEFRGRAAALNEAGEARHKELWEQLTTLHGMDPSATLGLDLTYLEEHGLVFLTEEEPQEQTGAGGMIEKLLSQATEH